MKRAAWLSVALVVALFLWLTRRRASAAPGVPALLARPDGWTLPDFLATAPAPEPYVLTDADRDRMRALGIAWTEPATAAVPALAPIPWTPAVAAPGLPADLSA